MGDHGLLVRSGQPSGQQLGGLTDHRTCFSSLVQGRWRDIAGPGPVLFQTFAPIGALLVEQLVITRGIRCLVHDLGGGTWLGAVLVRLPRDFLSWAGDVSIVSDPQVFRHRSRIDHRKRSQRRRDASAQPRWQAGRMRVASQGTVGQYNVRVDDAGGRDVRGFR